MSVSKGRSVEFVRANWNEISVRWCCAILAPNKHRCLSKKLAHGSLNIRHEPRALGYRRLKQRLGNKPLALTVLHGLWVLTRRRRCGRHQGQTYNDYRLRDHFVLMGYKLNFRS